MDQMFGEIPWEFIEEACNRGCSRPALVPQSCLSASYKSTTGIGTCGDHRLQTASQGEDRACLPPWSWESKKVVEAVYARDYAVAWTLCYVRADEATWVVPLPKTGSLNIKQDL